MGVDKPNDQIPPLLAAASGKPPSRIPVWFMRQAGRSLPEYRQVRAGIPMLTACLTPDLAAEITCQPVRRHDVDGAVFFSDIVTPMKLADIEVSIEPGVGPVFAEPANSPAAIRHLTSHEITDMEPIRTAVKHVVGELGEATPVIGFAGAPFTLAAYLVEGRPSRDHLAARALMHTDPDSWDKLMTWTSALSTAFLLTQIEAGARVVQLFDSWVGSLSAEDYRDYVAPYSTRILTTVAERHPDIARIHFGTNTTHLLPAMAAAGASVMGIDHRLRLDQANALLGGTYPLQGNIDPALLFAGKALYAHTDQVLRAGRAAPGHIVNLGHGVPPTTDPQVLTDLVAYIHAQSPRDEEAQ